MAAKLSLELHMYFRFLRSRVIRYVNVNLCQHGTPLEILCTREWGICACAILLLFYVREVYFYVSIYLRSVIPFFEIWKAKSASSPSKCTRRRHIWVADSFSNSQASVWDTDQLGDGIALTQIIGHHASEISDRRCVRHVLSSTRQILYSFSRNYIVCRYFVYKNYE